MQPTHIWPALTFSAQLILIFNIVAGDRSHSEISFPNDFGGTGGAGLNVGACTGITSSSLLGSTVNLGFLSHRIQSRMY